MSQLAPSPGGGPAAPRVPPVKVRQVRGSGGTSVIVSLEPGVPYERLREELLRVLGLAPDRFRHATARLDLGDRDLALFDVRRVVHLLKGEFALTVTGLYTSQRALQQFAARELKLQVFARDPADDWEGPELAAPLSAEDAPTRPAGAVDVVVLDDVGEEHQPVSATAVTEMVRYDVGEDLETVVDGRLRDEALGEDGVLADLAYDDEVLFDPGDATDAGVARKPAAEPPLHVPTSPPPLSFAGGRRALTVARTLRGGQRISFPGDVIVFGDVNPGASVEAGGHILVFGALRGLAHAGMHGEPGCVIVSFDLRPTQLRIGPHIAFPAEDASRGTRGFRPDVAWVRGDRILIEEYRGRLPDPLPTDADPTSTDREHTE